MLYVPGIVYQGVERVRVHPEPMTSMPLGKSNHWQSHICNIHEEGMTAVILDISREIYLCPLKLTLIEFVPASGFLSSELLDMDH